MLSILRKQAQNTSLIVFSFLLFTPMIVFAQAGGGKNSSNEGVTLENPLNSSADTIPELMAALLNIVAMVALPLVILALVYTGFLFVKAQGNKTELAEAKKAFFWTIIGALVVLGAAALAQIIEGTIQEVTRGVF